jgi:hypothetical protein
LGKATELAKAFREVLQEEVKALAEEICSFPDEKRVRALAFLEDIASALGLEV